MAREEALRGSRSWFDCSDGEFEAAVADIASSTDPLRRIEEAGRWRDASPAAFYEDLGENLVGQDPLYLNDFLPPDVERLLKHLRLGGGSAPRIGVRSRKPRGQPSRSFGRRVLRRRCYGSRGCPCRYLRTVGRSPNASCGGAARAGPRGRRFSGLPGIRNCT